MPRVYIYKFVKYRNLLLTITVELTFGKIYLTPRRFAIGFFMAELCAQIILRRQHRIPRHLVPGHDATETRVRVWNLNVKHLWQHGFHGKTLLGVVVDKNRER